MKKKTKPPLKPTTPKNLGSGIVFEADDAANTALEAPVFQGFLDEKLTAETDFTSQPKSKKPERSLDLHGETVKTLTPQLDNFLNKAYKDHLHCVRIVTGRGLHSKDQQPVLSQHTKTYLKTCNLVNKFKLEAGGGAYILWLKTQS